MKTLHLVLIISGMSFTSFAIPNSNGISFPHAYGICFPGCGHPEEYFPPASLDNKTVELSTIIYSNSTMSDHMHYLWFRFFDKNTNQTIPHVSFMLVVTKQDQTLLRELLHTHTGILNVKVISTPGPTWNVTAAHEPILNGWTPYSDDEPIVVQAPLFNDSNSTYHFNIQVYTIDRDRNLFDVTDNPNIVPPFNFDLSTKDNGTIIQSNQNFSNEKQNPPVIVSQIELASPLAFFPDNQTCYEKPGFTSAYTCSTNVVPGHKVKCAYFIGSKTCEPLHIRTSGTNQTCLKNSYSADSAPQWFDIYNTLDTPVFLQNLTMFAESIHGYPNAREGPFPSVVEMEPHEKCTFPWIPIDEPLVMDLSNMSVGITYDNNSTHYNVTTPFLSDAYNDTRTWQFDGNKWTLAEQNTVPVPEFPIAVPVMLAGFASLIVFYRMKIKK